MSGTLEEATDTGADELLEVLLLGLGLGLGLDDEEGGAVMAVTSFLKAERSMHTSVGGRIFDCEKDCTSGDGQTFQRLANIKHHNEHRGSAVGCTMRECL